MNLRFLEAPIGFEPMNKGFAVRRGEFPLSLWFKNQKPSHFHETASFFLEAPIGFEPMNKGFAVRRGEFPLSLWFKNQKPSHFHETASFFLEAPIGFEPMNKGFADLPLKPLGYSAIKI